MEKKTQITELPIIYRPGVGFFRVETGYRTERVLVRPGQLQRLNVPYRRLVGPYDAIDEAVAASLPPRD